MKDIILGVLIYVGILLAFALPILLINSIVNEIAYGDWTWTLKECIVVKGGEE